jgi:hypothetical protein
MWGSSATAATIIYTLAGTGTGVSNMGGDSTPFTDLAFTIKLTGDTTTRIQDSDQMSYFVEVSSATITIDGKTSKLFLDSNSHFAVPDIKGPNIAALVFGSQDDPTIDFSFRGTGLSGYYGITNLSPVSVRFKDLSTIDLRGGDSIKFTSTKNVKFSATVLPEPATWVSLLLGLGAVGAALRRRGSRFPGLDHGTRTKRKRASPAIIRS